MAQWQTAVVDPYKSLEKKLFPGGKPLAFKYDLFPGGISSIHSASGRESDSDEPDTLYDWEFCPRRYKKAGPLRHEPSTYHHPHTDRVF